MSGPETHLRGIQQTFADVAEGFCPLCHVALITHDGRGCCPCGGCTYRLAVGLLEMSSCHLHAPKRCDHWQAIWHRIEERAASSQSGTNW